MGYLLSKYNVIVKEKDNKLLVFNSRSQALCWISSVLYSNILEASASEVDRLYKLGIIVDEKVDEFEEVIFEKNAFLFDMNPTQVGFVIAPTLLCNMNCHYCFENGVDDKSVMSRQVADEVLEFIKKQLDNNKLIQSLHIRWFGGEPCLAIDIIEYISKELIEYCSRENIIYNSMIVSNGLLLDKKMARRLHSLHIGRAQITIDGMAECYAETKGVSTECFYKVVNNIVEICGLLKIIVRINVTETNVDEIESLARFLLIDMKLNGKIWIYFELVRNFSQNDKKNRLTPYLFEKRRAEIMNRLINDGCIDSVLHDLPRKNLFSCGAMQCKSATIGPDGALYRCDNNIGKTRYVIGDSRDGFYRNKVDISFLFADYKKECCACNMLPICGGGCLEERIIEKSDRACQTMKQRLITDVNVYLKYYERRKKYGN